MPADAVYSPLLEPGTVLAGKYRIERVLGQGAMGAVLAARHLELGHDVAIKIVLPAALLNADNLERFAREGRAVARLTSPHVARVYDVGTLPQGLPFLVMELVRGRDLRAILENEGPQPLHRVATWASQVCDVLAEAHALGIVHRDIKPANLMLGTTPAGKTLVKVLDFGVSKLTSDVDARALTHSSTAVGSPAYMAPEQLASSKDVDGRSDVWALGVTLYELATGQLPFDGGSIHQLVSNIHAQDPLPPSTHNRSLPREFDAIVARCLAKRPAHRFQSMAELEMALAPLAVGGASGPRVSLRPLGNTAVSESDVTLGGAPRSLSVNALVATDAPLSSTRPRVNVDSGANTRRLLVGLALGVALLAGAGAGIQAVRVLRRPAVTVAPEAVADGSRVGSPADVPTAPRTASAAAAGTATAAGTSPDPEVPSPARAVTVAAASASARPPGAKQPAVRPTKAAATKAPSAAPATGEAPPDHSLY